MGVGYRDQGYPSSVTAPTGQKPQSKLWYADGRWWGVLWDSSLNRFTIHRFNLDTQATSAWTSTGVTVDVRPQSQADVLWDNGARKLYVVTHLKAGSSTADKGLKFLRFGYSGGTYSQEASHTVVNASVEAAVMDKDSTGRLWVTYTQSSTVMVAHSTTDDTTWTAPFVLPVSSTAVNVSSDDISAVVAYGDSAGRKIGVMWSNQKASALYFASHVDGAADTAWTLKTLCQTSLCPDDHLNVKSIDADASGHLYAVVKTSLNDKSSPVASDPLIVVYRLNPAGSWSSSTAWTVGDGDFTRAIVALDSQNRRVYTFAPGSTAGGTVYTKSSSFDTLSFPSGKGTVFMRAGFSGGNLNNPTSTKQTVNDTTGLLVLASMDGVRAYGHNYMTLGGSVPSDTTPPTVTAVSPAENATGVAGSTNVTATFSEAVDATTVTGSSVTLRDAAGASVAASVSYDAAARQATLNPTADLAPDSAYTATVKGGGGGVKDSAGNALAADKVWSFRTATGSSGGTQTVTVPASADTYVSSGASATNFGSSTMLRVDGSPTDVTYLKFDLSTYAGRAVQSAELRVQVTTSGSSGTQYVRPVADDLWFESEMTYTTRPVLGTAQLGRLGPTSTNHAYTIALGAAALAGDVGHVLSLGMSSTSTDGVEMGSRESATPPVLVMVLQ